MKILEVISNLEPIGGGETFAINLSISLNKISKLKVVILYKECTQMFIDRLVEHKIDYVILNKNGHIDLKNAKELREIIKSFGPDVIHTENNALITTYLALRGIKKETRPNVYHTMHLTPEEECSNLLVRLAYKKILRKKLFTPIAITEDLSNKSKVFYKLNYVPTIENGVDLSRFFTTNSVKERKYDACVVARFTEVKNHKFLINAFRDIKSKNPGFSAVFVGDGELFNEMKELAKKVAPFIIFTGAVSNPEVYVADSKIIVLGSRTEANPLSLLEGMAAGCVVVSSNVGGVKNIIKEENGFLYDFNDKENFVKIINQTLNNESLMERISGHNKEYSKLFSMDVCANRYLELFMNGRNNG